MYVNERLAITSADQHYNMTNVWLPRLNTLVGCVRV